MDCTLEEGQNLSADCSTLVLPALSIGNVGQLAVDLLISSTGAGRVGYLDEPSVLPCVGNDAYGPDPAGDLALPLEAYESPAYALAFIQQRSPVIKGMMIEFAKNLAHFVSTVGKKHVVLLSSLDSGRKKKIDASSHLQIYYLSNASDDGSDKDCENMGWKRLEEYDPSQRRWKYLNYLAEGNPVEEDMLDIDDELVDDYYPGLPFAALFSCCKAKGLKVTCLLCYCSEGDNIPESFQLAEAACKLLGLDPNKFHGVRLSFLLNPLCGWIHREGPPVFHLCEWNHRKTMEVLTQILLRPPRHLANRECSTCSQRFRITGHHHHHHPILYCHRKLLKELKEPIVLRV